MSTLEDPSPLLSDQDRFLLAFLAGNEAACPICGYNVHHLLAPRCPECGRPLTLRLFIDEPGSRIWIVLLLALCPAAGIGLFLLAAVASEGFPPELQWQTLIIFFAAAIPMPLLLTLTRRHFARLGTSAQWTITLLSTAITLGMILWFIGKLLR